MADLHEKPFTIRKLDIFIFRRNSDFEVWCAILSLTPPTPYGVGFRVTIPHFRGRYENACHAISRNRPLGARVPRFLLQQSRRPMN